MSGASLDFGAFMVRGLLFVLAVLVQASLKACSQRYETMNLNLSSMSMSAKSGQRLFDSFCG